MAEVYVGRRFRTEFRYGGPVPAPVVSSFVSVGRRFAALGLAVANAGYLAVRSGKGMWIKAGGVGLGDIDASKIVEVVAFDADAFVATIKGGMEPSSETPMAWSLFAMDASIGGIVHVHAPAPRDVERSPAGLASTENEVPYGTSEIASNVVRAFRPGVATVWIAGHGYVTVGRDLEEAADRTLRTIGALHPDRFAGPVPGGD